MRSFAIMQSNNFDFKSPYYSGYLGLGPYSSDSLIRDENIIYYLKQSEVIEHAVFSLYFQKNGRSSIKFGGYDNNNRVLSDDAEITWLRTINEKSWDIRIGNVEFDKVR